MILKAGIIMEFHMLKGIPRKTAGGLPEVYPRPVPGLPEPGRQLVACLSGLIREEKNPSLSHSGINNDSKG